MNERKTRIMVVDNDHFEAAMIQYGLESRGFEALVVEDGQKALKMVADCEPHLIILGVGRPDLNGFEVLRRIRNFSPVPIIMVSAGMGINEEVEGLRLGADDFVTTPLRTSVLIARVRAVLRRVEYSKQDRLCSFFRAPS
jgi:two-component system KDP operon response regulator KdpE